MNDFKEFADKVMEMKVSEISNPNYDARISCIINLTYIPVVSSNVESIAYDKDHSVLGIKFIGGGTYRYYDVPESIWIELMKRKESGESIGEYLYEARVTGRKPHCNYFYRRIS